MGDDSSQLLVTRFGEYTVAIRATEVESIEFASGARTHDRLESLSHTGERVDEASHGRLESLPHNALDLSSLFRAASGAGTHLVRLTNGRGSLLIGADVRIRQVAGDALHRVPPFLDIFTRRTAIESFVVVGDGEIAFLVDPASLQDRMHQHDAVEGEEAS